MEKIYMQESEQQRSSKSSHSSMFHFSVVLSFFVAIFAIVSLIAAGFNQISYAAPANTFTFYAATSNGTDPIMINATGGGGTFAVPVYMSGNASISSSNAVPIFCIEHHAGIADRSTYTYEDEVDDLGLLYILNKSGVLEGTGIVDNNVPAISSASGDTQKKLVKNMIETYATQVAIWVYRYHKYYLSDKTEYAEDTLATTVSGGDEEAANNLRYIERATTLDITNYPSLATALSLGDNFYEKYVYPVIYDALNYRGVKEFTVSKANNTISKVGDDTYYQSAIISVIDPTNDLVSYDVELHGEGISSAFVVDEDGNKKSEGFSPDEKFYVRVPVKDVTQKTGKVIVVVNGLFDNYLTGSIYGNSSSCDGGPCQKVVSVTGNQGYETNGVEIDFVGSPSTGMSKGQTIFFIGLVVLLCGVGIIYANAKPVEIDS